MSASESMDGKYTYDDYCTWPDDERWELIGGLAWSMSPAPSVRHQKLVSKLCRRLEEHFQGKRCDVLPAPLDVKLSDCDVVQPDVTVVCDPKIVTKACIEGPPSMVVEILSPSTARKDRRHKMALYASSGVPEYWIVTPFPSTIEVLTLDSGRYVVHSVFEKGDILKSPSFPDLAISTDDIFDFPLTDEEQQLMVVKEPPAHYRRG